MARKPSEAKRNTTKVRILKGPKAHKYYVTQALRDHSKNGTADYTRLAIKPTTIANLFSDVGIKQASWLALRPKLEEIGLFYSDEEIEIFNPKELATQPSDRSSLPEIDDPKTECAQRPSSSLDDCTGVSINSSISEATHVPITSGPPAMETLGISQNYESATPICRDIPRSGTETLESVLSDIDRRATSKDLDADNTAARNNPINIASDSTLSPHGEMDRGNRLGPASSVLVVGLLCGVIILLSRFWISEPKSGQSAPNLSKVTPVPERVAESREPARQETHDESAVAQLSYSVVSKPSTAGWDIGNRDADLDLDIRIAHGDNVKNLNELEGSLESGDSLKIRLFSKRPQYHQLFWLDSSGGVYRLYPEDTAVHSQSSTIELPPARDDFFVVKAEVEGLHAIVAMASQAPFNQSLSLEPLPQPSSRISFEQGAIFFDRQGIVDNPNRSNPIASSRTATKHDPIGVLSSLTKSNANNRADVVRAVCFVIELN